MNWRVNLYKPKIKNLNLLVLEHWRAYFQPGIMTLVSKMQCYATILPHTSTAAAFLRGHMKLKPLYDCIVDVLEHGFSNCYTHTATCITTTAYWYASIIKKKREYKNIY